MVCPTARIAKFQVGVHPALNITQGETVDFDANRPPKNIDVLRFVYSRTSNSKDRYMSMRACSKALYMVISKRHHVADLRVPI